MRVFVQDSAYADLERICRWTAQDSPQAASKVVQKIGQNIERLGFFPRIGQAGSARETFEWVVPRLPYVIVY